MRSHQWAQVLHTLLRAMTFFTLCTRLHRSCGSGHLGLLRVQVHHIENR
jgi:hypothetical protein